MREFFNGWRRKAGCVTLVMGLALMGLWIRGFAVADIVRIGPPSVTVHHRVAFCRNGFVLETHEDDGPAMLEIWRQTDAYDYDHNSLAEEPMFITISSFRLWGVDLGKVRYFDAKYKYAYAWYAIPYWSLMLPLTLLSAYLILWKPRKQQPTASKPHA